MPVGGYVRGVAREKQKLREGARDERTNVASVLICTTGKPIGGLRYARAPSWQRGGGARALLLLLRGRVGGMVLLLLLRRLVFSGRVATTAVSAPATIVRLIVALLLLCGWAGRGTVRGLLRGGHGSNGGLIRGTAADHRG
jgi:hypothetical protein